ncbi:hypothetical protein AYO47_06165 [Planctomyces sp. SCGC AG-212-M04]|nr:hypothetical protein AYO47_06165 [Planctomyces sp. SCGC AG-212-M04]
MDDLLPVVDEPRAAFHPLPPPVRWLVRLTRAAILVVAFLLIARSDRAADEANVIPFETALQLFPTAARLGPRDARLNGWTVLASDGHPLGIVFETSPQTDHLVGYSGPSNLLLGLDPQGAIVGVRFLSSRDTTEHVEQVRSHPAFWSQFRGWNPTSDPRPRVDAVSGSTLTSYAMAESIEERLAGHSTSLRFPNAISLEEARGVFPEAQSLKPDSTRLGWLEVRGAEEQLLGFVLRTSPYAESVRGYSGPTEALIAVDPTRTRVAAIRMRSSYDTPDYAARVRADEEYLRSLADHTLEEWTQIDFESAGIEGVSGSTQTSYGLAEGIRRRLKADLANVPAAVGGKLWKRRNFGLLAIIAGGLLVTFVPAFGGRRIRTLWQIVLVAAFGLWLGDMLSMALLAGWARNGVAWSTAPGLVALVAVALVVPWSTKRQVYCHSLCPHGAVQEWLGHERRCHVHVPRRLSRLLGLLPGTLLAVAFGLSLTKPRFNLARFEPFDAWVLWTAAAVSMLVGLAGLVAAVFVPMAYCRFGCPTGALLKLVRSHGQADRWSLRDFIAAAAVSLAAAWMFWSAPAKTVNASGSPTASVVLTGPSTLTGRAFGTTWTIKIRDPLASTGVLQEQVAAELERIESKLSHWRPGSETSQFNASQTTLEIECSKELASLVSQARGLSEATDGAFDITVGPLVNAWGYGPSGPKPDPPSVVKIRKLLDSTGWQKLEVDESVPSLRKQDPALQIDLGALLQGYAVDRVHDLLAKHGLKEYLVEIGGELRASGAWEVALDPAAGAWSTPTIKLRDQALSTSGVYRRGPNGEEKHVISPRTGRPAATAWRAVAVMAPTCREADGWDTALLVAADGRALAEQRGFKAQFIPREGPAVQVGDWSAK